MRGDRSALARLLQERREEAGYSRAKLGEVLEISPGTIEGWELGRVERPPIHDVILLAEFLQISYDDLRAAVTADSGRMPPQPDAAGVARRPKSKKSIGAMLLLEASFRLFRWKDEDDASAALGVSPEQVRRWRQRAERMSVVDYLSLTAMVNVGIAQATRSPEASALDLDGAVESLGLRVAET